MRFRVLGLVVLAGFAFGSSTVSARIAIQSVDPYYFLVIRFLLAGTILGCFLLWTRTKIPTQKRIWLDIFVVGSTTALAMLLFTFALKAISSGVLSLFIAMIPVLTAVLAYLWIHEKTSRAMWAGLLIALLGAIILITSKTTGINGHSAAFSLRGQGLAIAGVLIATFSGVYLRKNLRKVDVSVITAGQQLASLIIVLPAALFFGNFDASSVSTSGWWSIVYSALIGSVVAFWVATYITKHYGAVAGSLPTYVIPVFATILGMFMLNEVVSKYFLLSMLLIIGGVALSSQYGRRTKRILNHAGEKS